MRSHVKPLFFINNTRWLSNYKLITFFLIRFIIVFAVSNPWSYSTYYKPYTYWHYWYNSPWHPKYYYSSYW